MTTINPEIQLFLFFAGFFLLIKGSDFLVEGSLSMASRFRISTLVAGLLITGIGTSLPELGITFLANLFGNTPIGVGTVVGSNTFNLLFILGLAALIHPLAFHQRWVRRDMWWNVLAVLLVLIFILPLPIFASRGFSISRAQGFFLFLVFVVWIGVLISQAHDRSGERRLETKKIKPSIAFFMVGGGLAAVLLGAKWVVDGAVLIANTFGFSQNLIGLTIVGIGTSFPELAITLTAAIKKRPGMAIGNVIGSNIFDFLLILGLTASVKPIAITGVGLFDAWVTFASAVIILGMLYVGKKNELTRAKGLFAICLYAAYLLFVIARG